MSIKQMVLQSISSATEHAAYEKMLQSTEAKSNCTSDLQASHLAGSRLSRIDHNREYKQSHREKGRCHIILIGSNCIDS